MEKLIGRKGFGALCVIAAAVMWALEPIVARYSYVNANFIQTTTIRAIVTTVMAFVYIVSTSGIESLKVKRSHLIKIAFIGIIGTTIADLLYFYSFNHIPVINAVLIGHMQPIFIIILGLFIFSEEKHTGFDYIFIISMIIASLLITTKSTENLKSLKLGTYGDLLVLISTILWALSGIIAKKYLSGLYTGALVFYRFLTASVILSIITSIYVGLAISNYYQIISGIIVFVGYMLYYEGLKRLKTAVTSSLELTAPFFASLFGYAFFGETITFLQGLGLGLIIIALVFFRHSE
ncbi:MAG: DMT family transporter [Candidatus Marinimicrobia bacterium]|nr:DMT family transporter [Candidatus Neomarinimicrobiota bacterium]